jgi:perosamine synthetase
MEFLPVCEPTLRGNETSYVLDALNSGWISSAGKYIDLFEEKFALFTGASHAISTVNGTSALHVSLVAMGIGAGDEVIIPNFTMIASAFAVMHAGATPVFCEIDSRTWNLDPKLIESKISPRTKAIMPVHIFGTPCDMPEIMKIARKHGLLIIQDSAESHGAKINGTSLDNFGEISAYSFYANKNLTTGEGGMVTTSSDELNLRTRKLKNLSFNPLNRNYLHDELGFNYRMSNLQAAIGLAQLENAENLTYQRIHNAEIYRSFLIDIPLIQLQAIPEWANSVHWMNAIVIDPDSKISVEVVMDELRSRGIDSRRLFQGMHRQPALAKFSENNNEEEFLNTNLLSDNGMYLPSSSHLSKNDIERVVTELESIINKLS